MNKVALILWFLCGLKGMSFAQEAYNRCDNAKKICYDVVDNVNNIGANSTLCPNCEDDFSFCFEGSGGNSVWFYFDTNEEGGSANVRLTNLDFTQGNALNAVVIDASVPCVSSSYDTVSMCFDSITGNQTIVADSLEPSSRYYVIVSGAENATASFDITITGAAVEVERFIYIDIEDPAVCDGQIAQIVATIEGCDGQQAVRWFVDGELAATTSEKLWETDNITDGMIVTAEVFCPDNCEGDTLRSNELPLSLFSFPVDAGPDFEIIEGESVQLQGSTPANQIEWTPPIAISNPTSLTPYVSPTETLTYYLAATIGNCTITDFCEVSVKKALTIPNTFTPNDDGINDTWEILGIEKYPDCLIQVFTRWGQLVFQTTGYNETKRWDGTSSSGNPLAPSAYYYVINLRSADYPEPLKGYVTIVR